MLDGSPDESINDGESSDGFTAALPLLEAAEDGNPAAAAKAANIPDNRPVEEEDRPKRSSSCALMIRGRR